MGFLDFSQADAPLLQLFFRSVPALATIGGAATADIGQSSDLDITAIGFTANQLNFNKKQLRRPYN